MMKGGKESDEEVRERQRVKGVNYGRQEIMNGFGE
tara:strand:- start:539 stop:643 length:105 start_codon:yes stop_codon:yes gene_type:complete